MYKNSQISRLSRRRFVATSVGVAAGLIGSGRLNAQTGSSATDGNHLAVGKGIFKSVKWGMIQVPGSVREKFDLMKTLGYDGMELVSPIGLDAAEVRAASEATGMPVHGVVDTKHWKIRLSDPDPKIREQGRGFLEQSLRESEAFGGNAVLLVPGKVTGDDETHDDVWSRSIAEIRKVLPLASRLGVRVLIENVWNGFCETPEQFRDYLDEMDSPWVGAYFDIGNVRKFSPSEDWIRTLGSHIVKVDVKDWGVKNGFCKIGDGDVNWLAVRKALHEIGFTGWSTAEVSGGDRERLADIFARMNRVLGATAK
ncbi:MAG: sugar phosphate isomerase/epimerase [Planctomycetes bacterium]|nr:sugar phosphate isomerase/epimerase [Planctomycetota bacterium]